MSKNTYSNVKYQQTNANREMSEIHPCLPLNITTSAQMKATVWCVKARVFLQVLWGCNNTGVNKISTWQQPECITPSTQFWQKVQAKWSTVCKVMDNIYCHKGTKLLFQANPTLGFANLSLNDGTQHNELSQGFSHCSPGMTVAHESWIQSLLDPWFNLCPNKQI